MYHQPRAGAKAHQREEDEEIVQVETATADESGNEAGECCDDGQAEQDADGCMERKAVRVSVVNFLVWRRGYGGSVKCVYSL